MEQTLVLLKPEAFEHGKHLEILNWLDRLKGLYIVAIQVFNKHHTRVPVTMASSHYPNDPEWKISLGEKTFGAYREKGEDPAKLLGAATPMEFGAMIRLKLVEYLQSGTIWALIVEGDNAVQRVRDLVGPSDPSRADRTTVRGYFGGDSYEAANREGRVLRNWIHASDSTESAEREIGIWFPQ